MRWLRSLRLRWTRCSRAAFADYLARRDARRPPRQAVSTLEEQIPECSRAGDRPTALLPRDRHALRRRAVRRGRQRSAVPEAGAAVGLLGDRPVRAHLRPQAPPRLDHQGRPAHARRLLVEAAHHYRYRRGSARRSPAAKPARTRGASRSPGAPNDACTSAGSTCATSAASPPASSRSPSPASSPHSSGRPPHSMPDHAPPRSRPGRCRGAHEHPGRPTTVARGSRRYYGQPAPAGRARS